MVSTVRAEVLVQVLSEIATDLAGIRDVDAVLRAIVQRTRAVTGSDMAYLSLNDHAGGETYIRESDGVRTETYRSIRMPLGTGVLGKAATGMSLVSTVDYLADPAIVHLEDIDEIVRQEGVRAILGVPMNVHGRIQGALLIADRRCIEYSAATVEIVDAIARQAAVAIYYSARLAEVTDALARLDAQQDARRARVLALQELLDLDRRMVEAVVQVDGVTRILDLLQEVYGFDAELLGPVGVAEEPLLQGAMKAAAAGERPIPVNTSDGALTVAAVVVGGQHFGYVLMHGHVPPGQWDVLEHGALHLGLSLLMGRIEADAQRLTQRELLEDLISGRRGASTDSRLRQAGIDPRSQKCVLAVDVEAPFGDVVRLLRSVTPRALMAMHSGHLCILHQGSTPLFQEVHETLGKAGYETAVGYARVTGAALAQAHRRAEIALASLRVLGGRQLDGDGLGALGVLLEADAEGRLPGGATAPLKPLLASPRADELIRTAWHVLEFGPSVAGVAERLYIHPNTLRQRMERIGSLLGADWNSGPAKLDLHLALRAKVIRDSLQEQGSDAWALRPELEHG